MFPPHYGIGGRRWAKHANALTKLGYTVHVIYAKNPFPENSLWTDLVTSNPNIKLYELQSYFPKVLVRFGNSIFEKIQYRFYVKILPLFTKGSYLDRTIFWKNPMLKKAREIIVAHQIKHVICTGAPFGAMYFTTLLKRWFNDIFIVNDMRDPWTWGPNWGFPNLEKKRFKYESSRERKTIEESDLITVPTVEMKKDIDEKYPASAGKIKTLLHFFDKDEIVAEPKTKSDKVRLIFYGNIYHHIPELIDETARTIGKYKDKIELDIYTDKWQHKETFAKHGASNVRFFHQLPAEKLFRLMKNYDYVFLMIPGVGVNHISTKFFEIIYSRTPFLIFCEPGDGPEFITSNKLGIHITTGNLYKAFDRLAEDKEYREYNAAFNVDSYSLEKNAEQISQILETGNSFNVPGDTTKNILITFDYELFLGKKSGSVWNSIIYPTKRLLEVLSACKLTNALFFVDTVYISHLEKISNPKAAEDLRLIKEQLITILKSGHFIYPHLHAHWLDAKYDAGTNEWNLNEITHYRFHTLQAERREEIFAFSIDFIKNLQSEAGIYYPIDCYRAGGWCIQPFRTFKPYFEKYGLKNDFSVIKNFKLNNSFSYYDFKNVPSRLIYNFEDEIEVNTPGGQFTEFSITSVHLAKYTLLANRLYLRASHFFGSANYGDGISSYRINDQEPLASENLYDASENREITSIEHMTPMKQRAYYEMAKNNKTIHFISHPKMISEYNLKCFARYMNYLKKHHHIETNYSKIYTSNV